MNLEIGLSIAGILFGAAGLAVGFLNWKKQRALRELLEFLAKQNEDLEKAFAEQKTGFAADHAKVAEHTRKIAWLETRIRKPNSAKEEPVEEKVFVPVEEPKLNVAEKRHRVLKLAALGQDAASIATQLGMMAGEVELIIKLNRTTV